MGKQPEIHSKEGDEADFGDPLDREKSPTPPQKATVEASLGGETPGQAMIREARERARSGALAPGQKPAAPPDGPSLRVPKGPTLTQALRILTDGGREDPANPTKK